MYRSCVKISRLLYLKLLPLLVVLTYGFVEVVGVAADALVEVPDDPILVFGVTQQDLNGDGGPDVTQIDCAFATGSDRVLVYDQMENMQTGSGWEEATDFTDDVWVFDVGADGTAQLIVDSEMVDELYTAFIYDDVDGDGQVSYALVGHRIVVSESSSWTVKVQSDRPWSPSDELSGARLEFWVDGNTELGPGIAGVLKGDGLVDWQYEIGDRNGDDINDYQLRRVVSPTLTRYNLANLHKSALWSQVVAVARQPTPYANSVFWPLIVGKHYYEDYRYFDHLPAIAVDWTNGVVDRVGTLGYPIEEGYHIYSRLPCEKDAVNAANFENPMAYFDMANDRDGWPELQVRFNVAVSRDPYFPGYQYAGAIGTPNLEVNYSWDQDNDNRWDYKFNLGANYGINEVVEFPDFAIKSVPYDEIVPWVMGRTWDVAMLVFDSRPSPDSEGMFGKGWMIDRGYAKAKVVEPSGLSSGYLMGLADRPPTEYYQDIQEGMRGEYSFQYFDMPKMYLSALDRQLHLSGAQSGVRKLGAGHYLRYANLDHDAYLDQWQEERDGYVTKQLNASGGIYVYSGSGSVHVKQSDLAPALFETQPPGNNDEWLRLDAQLKANQMDAAPEDFAVMLGQIAGHEARIRGAATRDYRITAAGFRFVLELEEGFTAQADPELRMPLPEAPGTYLIEYDGAVWSLQPATPVALRVDNFQVNAPDGGLLALDWTTVDAVIANEGLEDVRDLPVCATLSGPDEQSAVLTNTIALVPGEGSVSVAWDWAPAVAGTWTVRVETGCDAGSDLPAAVRIVQGRQIEVEACPEPAATWFLSLGGRIPDSVWLLLAGVIMLAGSLTFFWTRESSKAL